jgi:hypothetical protein
MLELLTPEGCKSFEICRLEQLLDIASVGQVDVKTTATGRTNVM